MLYPGPQPVAKATDHQERVRSGSSTSHGNAKALLGSEEWRRVGFDLNLSARELELVRHIFEGRRLQGAALDMGLALGTVKTYVRRIYTKLGVSDQRELTLAVVSTHLQLARSAR